ncbi:MAG: hypothetical protein ACHQDE_02775 [Acidimicrobiia bacterium]
MRRIALVVAAVVVLLSTVGAGSRADAAELGRAATRRTVEKLVHQTYPDLAFGNIACPDHVVKRRGVSFTCTVQLPGTFLIVDARQTDATGTVSFLSPQAVISRELLRQFVATNASLPATVDCGAGPWWVARPGTKIVCSATLADGATRHAELTVNDTVGNVTITGVT